MKMETGGAGWLTAWKLATLIAAVLMLAGSATVAAQVSDGTGQSYWGTIASPGEPVQAAYESNGLSAWEYPLLAPWVVASVPFEVLRFGLKSTVGFLDESGTLYRIQRLLGPVDLPYGFTVTGAAGNLVGIGGSLGVYHDSIFGPSNKFQARFSDSSKRHTRATAGFIRELGSPDHRLELGGGYRRRPNARFYGVGPGALESGESHFTSEATWGGLNYHVPINGPVAIEGSAVFSVVDSRGPREPEEDISLEEVYEEEDRPSGYTQRSDGWVVSLGLVRDNTLTDGRPNSGGVQRLGASHFSPNTGDASFTRYRAEVQQFLPLWFDRVLAVRGYWSWLDADRTDVNFQRLMVNDDPDVLRGYSDFRWRDRGMLAFTAEYRYPIWAYSETTGTGLDAYLFFDWGQVFGQREQIALTNLTESYGLGVRLAGGRGFSGRLEIGFSDEDTVIRLRGDQLFQFGKRGLYHGRNPVPAR